MKNFVYIIAEYNPPHKGHAYLISEARRLYPDAAVVAIMSGNLTERGSPAVTDKFTRARAALSIGCDLVLSLPFPFSSASAENFARGGVHIASAFAHSFPEARHALVFGSECGDVGELSAAADRVSTEEFRTRLYSRTRGGHNAREIQAMYAGMYGKGAARVMDGANDSLGIEYIRAISREGVLIEPCAVRRTGAGHDDGRITDGTASASVIRSMMLREKSDEVREFMPPSVWDIISEQVHGFADEARMGASILAILRMIPLCDIDSFAECGGGVGRRLISAALASGTYDEMLTRAATKQYTNARLRRAALFAALGVKASDFDSPPQYTQLLAADAVGVSVLHDYTGTLPVLTKFADSDKLPSVAQNMVFIEAGADRIYTLAFAPSLPADTFLRVSPFVRSLD